MILNVDEKQGAINIKVITYSEHLFSTNTRDH